MLDRDPHPDQLPDAPALRPRSRSHKPKPAAKKQPQRGLGVAQLEKLRLEEQNKQHEAACLASLQQQQHSRYIHCQQQEQVPFLHFHHQNLLRHQVETPAFCSAPPKIKHLEGTYMKHGLEEPGTSLPSTKLNFVQSTFSPPAAMAANRCQATPLPLHIPQQHLLTEDEASTSLTSQTHDMCSPVGPHRRPSSAESRLSPILTRTSTASLVEKSWLNHLYDIEPCTEKALPLNDLSYARRRDNDQYQKVAAYGVHTAIATLHGEYGSRPFSTGKLTVRNEGRAGPFTDSILRSRSDTVFDGEYTSQVTLLDSPPITSAAGGEQMKELSSFQTISLCPSWSQIDKVFNRKRPWVCTQELSRPETSLKGVDLNTSADEMESELTEQGLKGTVPCLVSDDWNRFLGRSVENCHDGKLKGLVSDISKSWCDSAKLDEKPFMDAYTHGITFLSLQKRVTKSDNLAETPGEFLTLGPSSAILQKARNTPSGSGSSVTHPVLKILEKGGNTWYSQDSILKQVRDACQSSVPRKANIDVSSLNYQTSYLDFSLKRDVGFSDFVIGDKVGALLQHSRTDESLDLELRLSI